MTQAGLGGMFRMVTTCPDCQGRGNIITERCVDCRGMGRVPVDRRLEVKIPAGIHDGQAVRIAGEGEPPPQETDPAGTGPRGDLHVVARVEPHEQFERDGDHLLIVMPAAFTQLALGADVEVPGLGMGEVHELNLPAGTQHGASVPNRRGRCARSTQQCARGDIVVVVHLMVPKKLDDEQRALLEEYAKSEDLEVGASNPSFWNRIKDAVTGRG